MKHIDIEKFSNGELTHQINRELEAVARNIADPNTEAKATRKITVTITMKPNEQRDFITTSITTKSALAPTLGAVTALSVGKNLKTHEIEMAEIGNQIPGQMSMEDLPQAPADTGTVEVDGKTVDAETGEITGKVVDLRKKA
ncbi:hypothetical protein [Merdimonas faecis]|uniref:Replication terminator protein n=1 Tax=Merdimonas faecis TaxID=1653435 RepID=A0A9D2VXJ2_9FIRM|nr:hypothetical protein [Merdimonas faecis]HJH49600.1 hypothetical protein [Merdimonas faecis]